MSDTSLNNKRIAKNTILLYFRTFITMIISLYTSRVVLNTLGVTDYGIYNVVGGVVAMFGFINSSMSVATQRYLNFALGQNKMQQLKTVFSTSINIHLCISILIIFLGETVGLWFLLNKMTIPDNRLEAALWTYQCAIFSTIIMIISVPYNALIIAHEKMGAFAYISILEVLLKLLAVFSLFIIDYDKLILYSILMLLIQIVVRIIYGSYCKKHFSESKYHFIWDSKLFKEMSSFAGWNLWGNVAFIGFTQGLNVLLNMFFNPVVNAARGISVQIQNTINQFSSSFQMALNPQITKSYAMSDLDYMHNLIIRSSRFTFYLMVVISLPIFLETSMILKVWLGIIPDYTVIFVKLMLCVTIIDAVANPLVTAAAATGKIKMYQVAVGGMLLLILPVSYITLKMGGEPWSVFIVHLFICVCSFIVRLLFVHKLVGLSIKKFIVDVAIDIFKTLFFITIVLFLHGYLIENLCIGLRFIYDFVVIVLLIGVIYATGLSQNEKQFITNKVLTIIRRK